MIFFMFRPQIFHLDCTFACSNKTIRNFTYQFEGNDKRALNLDNSSTSQCSFFLYLIYLCIFHPTMTGLVKVQISLALNCKFRLGAHIASNYLKAHWYQQFFTEQL